jgi:hypothetical protein
VIFAKKNSDSVCLYPIIIGHCIIKIVCKDLLMVDVDDGNNGARFDNGSFCFGSTVGVVHT